MEFNKVAAIAKAATFAAVVGALAVGLAGEADAASGTMFGDPTAAAKWWRHQQYDDCVLMSTAEVVGQMTGKEPSERAVIAVAQSTPSATHPGSIYVKPADKKNPNSGMGTSMLDIPTLLAYYGVDAKATEADRAARTGIPTGMGALEQFLGGGHKVIVSVNAEMIWHKPVEEKDSDGKPRSDHAVVVTGVDTVNGVVHLNDSGTAKGRDEQIPMQLFTKAWATGHNFMVVTTDAVR
ncbi:hypothetical protein [Mycobacterium sp.]|uniref:hypothetical protein n=1 Tax=Mycobacterium sp. TaxID=1785 RepID=UPI003F94AEE7